MVRVLIQIDNLLPDDIFTRLVNRLEEAEHWGITSTTTGKQDNDHKSMSFMRYHHNGTPLDELLGIVADRIGSYCGKTANDLLRVRGGLIWRDGDSIPNKPHTDLPNEEAHTTALLYINDTDGDTYFYKESGEIDFQVSPKANKAIIFDGSIVHSSSTPTQTPYRITLNFNFAGKANFNEKTLWTSKQQND